MSRIGKTKLAVGAFLMVTFLAVLVAIFLPLIEGHNALDYLDNLYNSISKGSAYYVPKVQDEVAAHGTERVSLELELASPEAAQQGATLLRTLGAEVTVAGTTVAFAAPLDEILGGCLRDADDAYHNRGAAIAGRHGMHEKEALHAWWLVLGALEKSLNEQKSFAAAKLAAAVKTKTVECAYNYYGIEAQSISQRWGIVLFSLVFYVVYTVWYGYAVMFLFEGFGFRLSH